MPAREAFVAEVFPDLKQLVDAADEQPLVVKLQRDAQIKFAAERVVKGLERLRRCAAGNRLHRGRLDFDVAATVKEAADFVDDGAAFEKNFFHVRIANQIKVTLTVANFGVFESVPFRGRRAQRFGDDGEGFELDARFAGFGAEQRAGDADEIAEVEVRENIPASRRLFFHGIFLRVNLDASALVAHVNEHGFAHLAVRGDAPGDGHAMAFGQRAGIEAAAGGVAFGVGREFILERVNAFRAQGGELGLALFDE